MAAAVIVVVVTSFNKTLFFSSDRQHLSYDVCLEVRLSELFCVALCTEAVHSQKPT